MALRDEVAEGTARFVTTLAGVPEGRWSLRPAEGAWSPAEIAEHVTAVEISLVRLLGTMLTSRADAAGGPPAEARVRTALRDDARRPTSPDPFLPTGRWADRPKLIATFESARFDLVRLAETDPATLRARRRPHPMLGPLDGVDWIVFAVEHAERHRRQVERILAAD